MWCQALESHCGAHYILILHIHIFTYLHMLSHILKFSLQLPHTTLSNNPPTVDFSIKQFKHSLSSGTEPEFRWEKTQANRNLHTFRYDLMQKQREGPCWGAHFSSIWKRDIWQETPPVLGFGCFLSLFFHWGQCFRCLSSIFSLLRRYKV